MKRLTVSGCCLVLFVATCSRASAALVTTQGYWGQTGTITSYDPREIRVVLISKSGQFLNVTSVIAASCHGPQGEEYETEPFAWGFDQQGSLIPKAEAYYVVWDEHGPLQLLDIPEPVIAEVQPGLSVAEALHLDLADCLKAIGFCSEKKGPVEYVWLHNLSDEAFSVYPNSLGQVEKSIDLSPRSAKKIPCPTEVFQYIFFRKTDPTRTVKVVPVHPRPHPAPTP